MTREELSAERVAAWKASGQSPEAFVAGKGFTPGDLRHWAHQFRHQPKRAGRPAIRFAKVVPLVEPVTAAAESPTSAPLVLESGPVRVEVRPGFDRASLAAVLEVLRGPK